MRKSILFSIGFIVTCGWLATGIAWAAPPFPVPAKGGLPACKAELAVCTGDLDSCDLAYDTCTRDLTTCTSDLGTCDSNLNQTTAELMQCESDLATCEATAQAFPATGQTSCWYFDDTIQSYSQDHECTNPLSDGQDGDIKAGAKLSYTDTGLTIIDNNTQLEWMKQDLNGGDCASYPGYLGAHCMFTWDEAFAFVAQLNTDPCLAGHCDWRVPNVKELQSIVSYETRQPPAVSTEFDTCANWGCTVETCSCTSPDIYWSSTTLSYTSDTYGMAWVVAFFLGNVLTVDKNFDGHQVRPVRGGVID